MSSKVAGIVQARIGSTRLPGKSMMLLAGKPLVQRVLERIKNANRIDELILAIPNTPENEDLEKLGRELDVTVYKGSEQDLVDRYFQAALISECDYIVRIPADNPVPQGSEIDRIISHHINLGRKGFSSNLAEIYDSRYPDGIGAEIFDTDLLDHVHRTEIDPNKREHVHLNFFDYSTQKPVNNEWCPVSTINCPSEFARPDLILDVNTIDQYQYMAKMYNDLYPVNPNFSIKEIIEWHDLQKLSNREVSKSEK
jgi:spore coat polysaccharide biosynthesis protein SpsF